MRCYLRRFRSFSFIGSGPYQAAMTARHSFKYSLSTNSEAVSFPFSDNSFVVLVLVLVWFWVGWVAVDPFNWLLRVPSLVGRVASRTDRPWPWSRGTTTVADVLTMAVSFHIPQSLVNKVLKGNPIIL
jgi:hypothetical protein